MSNLKDGWSSSNRHADLRRVAGDDEVLAVVVGEDQVLPTVVERVQLAVRVLLPLAEVGDVPLVAVGVAGAEEPDRAVDVEEEEAAEVVIEELVADPDRGEVIVGAGVEQLGLDEGLLQRPELAGTRRPLEHVGADDPELIDRQVVEVERRGEPDLPVGRLERGVAVVEVERQNEEVGGEVLVGPAEEVELERPRGALERRGRRRDLAELLEREGQRRDVHEQVLPRDREVALEHVLVERVEDAARRIEVVAADRVAVAVPVILGVADAPAVLDGDEVGVGLPLARQDA